MEPMERTRIHKTKLERTATALRKRGFEAAVFDKAADARDFLFGRLTRETVIAHGGSKTLAELEILERLRAGSYQLLDRARPGLTPEEKGEIERRAFSADVYLASANALAEEGAVVNIDMWGNRTGAIEFGPRKVYLFVGRNKLAATLTDAIGRARNSAAVMNAMRFEKRTPCVADGQCHDCSSPDRICSILSIIERSAPAERICICLINEDLGY